MGIKVSKLTSTSYDTAGTTKIADIPEGESFQDVLVLNQTALKAMAIDAMVAESSTGSVNPDAVNAAAIMRFRGTLGSHIQAPIPKDDWDGGSPKVYTPKSTPTPVPNNAANSAVNTQNTIHSTTDAQHTVNSATNTQTAVDSTTDTQAVTNSATESSAENTSSVYNSGVLKCSDELNAYFLEASKTYGVDVKFLKSIARAESNFNPECTSSAGAMGVMQLMPKTAQGLGVTDAYDARQNIMGGAKYISIQLERYDGNMTLALAAYNAGPGNVKKYGGVPPFEETQNYVKKVLNYYNS